jgi:hypothetical protein
MGISIINHSLAHIKAPPNPTPFNPIAKSPNSSPPSPSPPQTRRKKKKKQSTDPAFWLDRDRTDPHRPG